MPTVAALVFVPAVPGSVIIIMAVAIVAVVGVSIVPQPDGVTGGIIITGIIKSRVKGTGIIIAVIALVIIITGSHWGLGGAPVETVAPSLLVHVVRVEAVRIFFIEIRTIACGKAPAVATFHKPHPVGCRLLRSDHGIHLRHAGGQQRRRPLMTWSVMSNAPGQE